MQEWFLEFKNFAFFSIKTLDNHAKLILTCSFQRIIFIYGHRPFMSLQLHSTIEFLENCNNNRAACFEVIRFDHMTRLTLFVREQLLMEATHRSAVAFIDRSAHPFDRHVSGWARDAFYHQALQDFY